MMYMSIHVFNKEQRNHDRPTAVTTTEQDFIKHYFSRCVLNWNFIGYSYFNYHLPGYTTAVRTCMRLIVLNVIIRRGSS
jgi:hypothetical protein